MPKIQLLPDILASQVAAGEVVERPASVVKELVENSLDAGAGAIEVVVNRGGIALIRVSDDGSGMSHEDALMSLERHATSKLKDRKGLGAIGTLGFRGEALPSIASVSKFTLSTRERGAVAGSEIRVDGGRVVEVSEGGGAPGTQIEVRSLFYNVPARRKFLKTEVTEFGHVEQQVRLQAMANPAVAFTLTHNGKVCFQLPAGGRRERIAALAGRDVAKKLIEVEHRERDGTGVTGFIGDPGLLRAQRSGQLFFLNGRPIDAGVLRYGVQEGYRGRLRGIGHPVAYLFLEIPLGEVDVNVHPAKREVRFRRPNQIRDAVESAVRGALDGAEAKAQPSNDRTVAVPRSTPPEDVAPPAVPVVDRSQLGSRQGDLLPASDVETVPEAPARHDFELLTALERGYVLLKSDEGLVLMDQRAAHERVLYEGFAAAFEGSGTAEQGLLVPVTVELEPRDFALVRENLPTLTAAGVRAEPFGANTLKVDALPACLPNSDAGALVDSMLEELRRSAKAERTTRLPEQEVAAALARLGAVHRGSELEDSELEALVSELMACEMPYCSPGGKPTLIQISYPEIERKFGR